MVIWDLVILGKYNHINRTITISTITLINFNTNPFITGLCFQLTSCFMLQWKPLNVITVNVIIAFIWSNWLSLSLSHSLMSFVKICAFEFLNYRPNTQGMSNKGEVNKKEFLKNISGFWETNMKEKTLPQGLYRGISGWCVTLHTSYIHVRLG